jgi:creatinine amidohydrolase
MSEHHMSLGGTLTLDYRTMAGHRRVRGALRRASRLPAHLRLNGHGGNIAALEVMLTELTIELELPLAGGTYWHIAAKSIREILEHQPQLIHACEAETSILQALSPELVKPLDKSMRGALAPGMSSIDGVNPGVFPVAASEDALGHRHPGRGVGRDAREGAADCSPRSRGTSRMRSPTSACGTLRSEDAANGPACDRSP